MRIKNITVKRNYLLDPMTLEHQHIGVRIVVNEDEDPDEAIKQALLFIDKHGNPAYEKGRRNSAVKPADWTTAKEQISAIPYREDAANYLKIQGLTYIKELNDIVAQKPLKNNK